jgi:hypothetical protein
MRGITIIAYNVIFSINYNNIELKYIRGDNDYRA